MQSNGSLSSNQHHRKNPYISPPATDTNVMMKESSKKQKQVKIYTGTPWLQKFTLHKISSMHG